jgi:phosphoglycerate dehydrogenase-like enzyme
VSARARARVAVLGASQQDGPPGIEAIADTVDLAVPEGDGGLAGALEGADVLFAWRPDGAALSEAWGSAGSLKWIQSASAGVDSLMFPDLAASHVVLTNARGIYEEAMAEYVLGLMLVMSKGLRAVLERQGRAEWDHRQTERLERKRVLVVGTGPIGRTIARDCRALRMSVRGVARTAHPGDADLVEIFGVDRLTDAVATADYVVNTLPATEETRHLFDEEVFAAMSPSARFVNVGRGSTVDETALIAALRSGGIAGAGLDVFEEEPLPADSPLWAMPNVIVSPHMAGDAAGWREAAVELFVRNLERYLTGRPLLNVVDKTRGYVPS